MKTVYFKNRFRGHAYHSLYYNTLNNPPQGVHIMMDPESSEQGAKLVSINRKLQTSFTSNTLWQNTKPLVYALWQVYNRSVQNFDVDLVFAMQQLVFAKIPWVVDLEFADALVGYGNIRVCSQIVKKSLSSEYCKRIMPWSEWSKKTLLKSIDCGRFKRKIEVVHLAVEPKAFTKVKNDYTTTLLFVGSTNAANINNFELKGGMEVLESFTRLKNKYPEIILIIRARVPFEIQEKYSNFPDIYFYNDPLSELELAHLYQSSDILLFPSHSNLGMATLEAMSYELPVVSLNIFDVPEAVVDMKTGILLNPPKKIPYYTWNLGPNHLDWRFFEGIRRYRPELVEEITKKTSLLIEDTSLRRRLGRTARLLVEKGLFSTNHRNNQLREIFLS